MSVTGSQGHYRYLPSGVGMQDTLNKSHPSSMNMPSGGRQYSQQMSQGFNPAKYPQIRSMCDLEALPQLSPEEMQQVLQSQNLTLGQDGTLIKKHIYRVKRHKGGACGCWNRCCCGCHDQGRVCDCFNKDGCCDRKRITYRRESGESDVSLWSAVTALKPMKRDKNCC